MARSRLETALADGALTLPDGPVRVLRPPSGYDVSALDPGRVTIVQGFRPDHDAWEAMGYRADDATGAVATIVVVPRSKALARALVADAVATTAFVVVDGQRTDGIDGLWRDLRARVGDIGSVTKAHGRLFWFDATGVDLSDWASAGPTAVRDGWITQPGVFAEGGPDRGSDALLAALPAKLPKRLVDLGAGWGYLSARILADHPEVAWIDLVEAEILALDCARLNVTDDRARFHWADAMRWQPEGAVDAVVANPPFHTERRPDVALGQDFVAAAARMLNGSGHLWLVANRHLPYEAALRERFASVEETGGDAAFKVFHAQRPRR